MNICDPAIPRIEWKRSVVEEEFAGKIVERRCESSQHDEESRFEASCLQVVNAAELFRAIDIMTQFRPEVIYLCQNFDVYAIFGGSNNSVLSYHI